MSESLSGLSGIKNLNRSAYENIYKLDDYLIQDDMQNPNDFSKIDNGFRKIDFSKISNDDPELKADLYGLIQKNQPIDNNTQPVNPEITTGDVANKFSDVLGNYLNSVNEKNREAEKAVETFASGGNIDLHSVMIASEKAGLSMQLAVQMRNKILQAYQEVSRIQV